MQARAEEAPSERDAGSVVEIEVFSRPDCPHCRAADVWLHELLARRPEVRVVRHDVLADPVAAQRLVALCEATGVQPPGVPAFWMRGVLRVGFADAATSGREIEALLRQGPPAARTSRVVLPGIGAVDLDSVGLPLFTIAVGLLDGFNPCAMWVLLLLLALLAPIGSRFRMAMVGGAFLTVGGLVYLAFLAAWLEAFRFIGLSRSLQVMLGLVAGGVGVVNLRDAVRGSGGKTLGIPSSAKPGIYARMRRVIRAENLPAALMAASALAVVVNFVELLCSAGFPALYTQVLSLQPLGRGEHLAYLLLYIACYVLDDAAVLAIAITTLGSRRLGARGARVLTALSGGVMLALGLALVLRPGWLAALGGAPVGTDAG